jgi:hypothetical protein
MHRREFIRYGSVAAGGALFGLARFLAICTPRRRRSRLNEWPEWFTVDEDRLYRIVDAAGHEDVRLGSDLKDGMAVSAPGHWTVVAMSAR